ncbi:MAG: amino acid kinase family protein [Promethearchaeota archaeon]
MGIVDYVFKIGGKLLGRPEVLRKLMGRAVEYRTGEEKHTFLMIPGGGLFADRVRDLYNDGKISAESAHWMAIKATEMSGLMMRNSYEALHPFSRLEDFPQTWAKGGVPAFFPFEMAFHLDELPHSWKVTSDSIAYWVGLHAGAKYVFLVKDVDGIHRGHPGSDFASTPLYEELTPRELASVQDSWGLAGDTARHVVVDPYLPELMEERGGDLPCVVLGHDHLDLIQPIVNGEPAKPCTIIRNK